jgi:predicted nucleic acid-binding protein
VLADTGPLYAAADPHDAQHKRAQQELKRLDHEQYEVLVAYPTLLESYTLVLFRLGRNAAAHWLKDMESAGLINPTADDYLHAVRRAQSLADQPITLFDATVATMASRLGMEVWTYDHHFDLMRVRVWR